MFRCGVFFKGKTLDTTFDFHSFRMDISLFGKKSSMLNNLK